MNHSIPSGKIFGTLVPLWLGCLLALNSALNPLETSRVAAAEKKAPAKSAETRKGSGNKDNQALSAPATVEQAARVLDLRKLPLIDKAEAPRNRSLARLSYDAPGTVKGAFEFQARQLKSQQWQELPGGYVTDQTASGAFGRNGFIVTVTATPAGSADQGDRVNLTIVNLGNVDVQKLPVPGDSKLLYSFPASTAWLSASSVDEAASLVREQFLKRGWAPYGTAGDSQFFKQNAVRVTATVAAAPAQQGKTAVTYSAELLSTDLPAPADALRVQFSDSPAQLACDLAGDIAAAAKYYRAALAKQGWQATTEQPVKIDFKQLLIFRNAALDLIEVEMQSVDDITRVLVRYQTAAEVAEIERQVKAEAERKKQLAGKPKPKLKLDLPAGAANIEASAGRVEFTVATGKAQAAVKALRKTLVDAGWKEEDSMFDEMFGTVSLKKEGQALSLTYVETGVIAPEITISASGLELEIAKLVQPRPHEPDIRR